MRSEEQQNSIFMQIINGRNNVYGFNSVSRSGHSQLFIYSESSNEQPESITTKFICNSKILIDAVCIVAPSNDNQKITIKFYLENGELLYNDAKFLEWGVNGLDDAYWLTNPIIILPNITYIVTIEYEHSHNVSALLYRSPQRINHNIITSFNFIEIGDTFKGFIFFCVM